MFNRLFPSSDNDIIRHASDVKISLFRMSKGRLAMSFEISGGVMPDGDDDDDDGGCMAQVETDPQQLADSILRRFIAATKKGGAS